MTASAPPEPLARRLFQPVVATVAAAFLAAALHAMVMWFTRVVLGQFSWSWTARDATWMLAPGYLVAFAPIGVLLAAIGALRRRGIPPAALAFVLVSAVTFAVLLLFGRVASVAWLVLALGVGARAATWARNRELQVRRLVYRIAAAGAIAYLAIAASQTWGRAWRENLTIERLQPRPGASSVLLIILDTVRASELGLFGYPRATTPTMDALARDAVVFDHAFAAAPWTLPSHASLFTGLWPSQHHADWLRPLSNGPPTLAEVYRANGYATGGFTANLLATGFSTGLHRGFVTYRDTPRTAAEIALHSTFAQGVSVQRAIVLLRDSRWLGGAVRALLRFNFRPDNAYQTHDSKPGAEVTDEFLKWERRLDGRPFFAFLNYYDAHGPYRSPMRTTFDGGRTPQDRYDGAVRYIDTEIARLVDSLRVSGMLDHCLLVITADHGEQFGEHGLSSHGNSLYLPLLHVPLLIRFPDRAAAGTHIATAVSLGDLGATLVALSKLRGANTLAGTSFDIPGNGADAGGRAVIAELSQAIGQQAPEDRNRHGGLTALLNDTLHVIRDDATGSIEAYRYRSDEGEKNDLAHSDVERATASRLLQEALRREGIGPVKQP
jgi:arylsulfatase A-like enzyme